MSAAGSTKYSLIPRTKSIWFVFRPIYSETPSALEWIIEWSVNFAKKVPALDMMKIKYRKIKNLKNIPNNSKKINKSHSTKHKWRYLVIIYISKINITIPIKWSSTFYNKWFFIIID